MEGVIAREREINWSEVHFHSAFKTRRHATQFGLSVGFFMHVFIPEYLGVNKSMSLWLCVGVCVCVRVGVCGVSVCPCLMAQISTGFPLVVRFTN